MSRREVKVICDAESHATRVAIVDRLDLDSKAETQGSRDSQYLVREDGAWHTRREVFGTADEPPGYWDIERERRVLRCKLCGLTVTMRQETTRRLIAALRESGVSTIRLSVLADML